MFRAFRLFGLLSLGLLACGDEQDRAELLDRMRGLGMQTDPLTASASQPGATANTIETTVYMAVPNGVTVSVNPFTDTEVGAFYNLASEQIVIDTDSFSYQAKQGFQLLSFTANVSVPTQAELVNARELRYGLEVSSDSSKISLLGAIPLLTTLPSGEGYQPLSLELLKPADGESLKLGESLTLQASVSNPNKEDSKFGWFVSGGKVLNRRAASTTWTPEKVGTYTILITARGLTSRSFAMKTVDVRVVD